MTRELYIRAFCLAAIIILLILVGFANGGPDVTQIQLPTLGVK